MKRRKETPLSYMNSKNQYKIVNTFKKNASLLRNRKTGRCFTQFDKDLGKKPWLSKYVVFCEFTSKIYSDITVTLKDVGYFVKVITATTTSLWPYLVSDEMILYTKCWLNICVLCVFKWSRGNVHVQTCPGSATPTTPCWMCLCVYTEAGTHPSWWALFSCYCSLCLWCFVLMFLSSHFK